MKVQVLNKPLKKAMDMISLDDVAGFDCRLLCDMEKGLIYSGG
jgi:hypothetical protein